MAEQKVKKIDRDYVLSDSSVNVYRYRLLTVGFQIEEYTINPIGYYLHGESPEFPKSAGVVVRWEDVRIVGDQILGKPVINLEHPRGERTVTEIENGFLNGASVGEIVVLEYHYESDPSDPECDILVVTKWYCKECSLVDKPGNRSAFIQSLMDAALQPVTLEDLSFQYKSKSTSMKKIELAITPELLGILSLSDSATLDAATVTARIKDLSDRAAASDAYKAERDAATTQLTVAKQESATIKAEAVAKQVKDLIDGAANKLPQKMLTQLAKQFATDPAGLKDLLDAAPTYTPIATGLGEKNEKELKDLSDKTWQELDRSGQLQNLKDNYPELYRSKFKEKFNKEPNA